LAFLLIKRGDADSAAEHLRRFLAKPPRDPEMTRWVDFARETLVHLERPDGMMAEAGGEPA
jgi:hypothetical protein